MIEIILKGSCWNTILKDLKTRLLYTDRKGLFKLVIPGGYMPSVHQLLEYSNDIEVLKFDAIKGTLDIKK